MTDTPRGVARGEVRVRPDGGVAGCWRAGDDPPPPPTDAADLVEHAGPGGVAGDRCYVLRVALAEPADEYALRVVEQLDAEVDVLGTTLALDVGPEEPGVFDVLVEMEYDPPTVTEALVEPPPVDAVTVARPDPVTTEGVEADDATVSEAVPDVGADAEGDVRSDVAGGAVPGDADGEGAPAGGDADPEATFERLRETTDRVGYEELLAELDETSLPGEFGEEADLRPLLEGAGAPEEDPGPASQDVDLVHGDGGRQVEGSPGSAELDPERVVDALVTAVETGALGDEQRRRLGEALDTGPPKTLQVRVDHVQRELDELTAYKDTLEAFIDEYGTGEGLVEQVRAVLEQFTEDVAALEGTVTDLGERVDAVEAELADVRAAAETDDVETRLAALEDDVSSLDDRVAAVETDATVDELAEDLAAADRRIEELEAWHDRIRTVLAGPSAADDAVATETEGAGVRGHESAGERDQGSGGRAPDA